MPVADIHTRYYLRVRVADRPGVLARVAGTLGDAGISIASVIQKAVEGEDMPEIVIMTHDAREADLQRALGAIANVEGAGGVEQVLRVLS
jgi:homoserine dehydrogenase